MFDLEQSTWNVNNFPLGINTVFLILILLYDEENSHLKKVMLDKKV